jgi:DNA polymerase III sliding clamp (beta) subunit (PCNA family)
MDFSIETGDLQRAIKLLSVTAKMNAKDPTGMILIQADQDNCIKFLSNNNSTALSYTSDKAVVRIPGSAVIEYSKVKSFASSFPQWNEKYGVKDFNFLLADGKLNVDLVNTYEDGKTSKGHLALKVYDAYNIRTPKPIEAPTFTLSSSIFRSATSKVLYAIDPSDQQTFVQGMNINFDEENICFVGTTGKELSEYKVKNISDLKEGSFTLRYDFIMALRRALGEESQIVFEMDNREVRTAFENICLWGRTIIGHEFPNYKPVLKNYTDSILLDKEVLVGNLLPFSDVLDPDDNYRLTVSIKNKIIKLYCDVASFTYDNEVDFDGEFVIDVNGQSMIQTVDVIKDDKILMQFSDDKGVLLFDSGNFEDQKALIAPLRRR